MIKLYGIKNCDTVKKARQQLNTQGIVYDFIDLKTAELSDDLLRHWLQQCPNHLVNKRSTTYRNIKDNWLATEDNLNAQITLIQQHPTLIKRPVLQLADETIIVGFDTDAYHRL